MRASGSVRRIQNVFPVWRGPKRKWDFLASHSFRSGRRSTTGGLDGVRGTVMSVVDYHDKRRLDRQAADDDRDPCPPGPSLGHHRRPPRPWSSHRLADWAM